MKRKNKSAKRKRSPRGEALLNQIIHLTGLPKSSLKEDLQALMHKKKLNLRTLTLDEFRGIAACYVREIMGNILDHQVRSRNGKKNVDH